MKLLRLGHRTPPGRDRQGSQRQSFCWTASQSKWGSRTAARWRNCKFQYEQKPFKRLHGQFNNQPLQGVNFDSLEYELAIASFHAASLRAFVRESLEQSLCLVLVLEDTPVNIIGQLWKQIYPYFPVCSSSWTEAARGSPSKTLAIIVIRIILALKQLWSHPKACVGDGVTCSRAIWLFLIEVVLALFFLRAARCTREPEENKI